MSRVGNCCEWNTGMSGIRGTHTGPLIYFLYFYFFLSVNRAWLFTMVCISLGTMGDGEREREPLERSLLHSLSMLLFVDLFSVVLFSGFLGTEDLSCIRLCCLGYSRTKKKNPRLITWRAAIRICVCTTFWENLPVKWLPVFIVNLWEWDYFWALALNLMVIKMTAVLA